MSPKNLTLALFITVFCTLISTSMVAQLKNTRYSLNVSKLERLIAKDSLYEATILLNQNIEYTKKHQLQEELAGSYNTLGTLFSKMGSYKIAETFYVDAYHIYDSLNKHSQTDKVLANLAKSYISLKDYKKFDSIIPIADKLSKALNSPSVFTNLESKIQKNNFLSRDDLRLEAANTALGKLKREPFDYSDTINEDERKRLLLKFTYYKANALIKLKQYNEGYKFLFSIDSKEFENSLKSGLFSFEKIATLNFFKYEYYQYHNKQVDSAIKYLLISDTHKYNAIKKIKQKNAENGGLLHKIINTQEQLKAETLLREKDKKISKAFFISTIISCLLILVLTGYLYHYYINRKKIKFINFKLKTYNKKLLEIDKERLEFFSVLSHELRTPIYGINGLATLIEQEQSPEKKQSYLNALKSSSNYISILIDNVLQATQLKFKNKTLRLKPVRISEVIQNITSTVKASAKNKGLDLQTNIKKSNIGEFVLADKVALSQILINLAYNSIRYTNEGFVSINVTEQNRTSTHVSLLFEIKDSGIGIKNEHKAIVFSAFENKAFLNKNSSGSGLGLFIVKTLLKSYESNIDFISKPDEGSNFFFNITFKLCEAPVIKPSNNDNFLESNHHILIVDDNKINLMVTQKNIERIPGYTCETVLNGKEAISLVKNKDFDLVLMDINMPEMNGYEVTEHIRLFNPNIPIVALTALNPGGISQEAESSGMNHIITKPYNFEEFKNTIQSYCQKTQHS